MDWSTVTVAIAAGAALVITALFSGIRDIIATMLKRVDKRIKRRTYVQQMERLTEFLELFEGLKTIPDIQRCLIFHGHNCGGLPTPGRPYTVRAIHGWSTKEDKEDPLKRYNFELQVDVHYIRMLEDVVKIGRSFQVTKEMPSEAKLKIYYEAEGVQYAEVYFLGIIDEELIFISMASYDEMKFSHAAAVQVHLSVDKMKSLVEEGS